MRNFETLSSYYLAHPSILWFGCTVEGNEFGEQEQNFVHTSMQLTLNIWIHLYCASVQCLPGNDNKRH